MVAIDLYSKSCIFLLSLTETALTKADRAMLCDTHHEMRIRLKQVKSTFDNFYFLRFSDEGRKGRVTHTTRVIPGEKKEGVILLPLNNYELHFCGEFITDISGNKSEINVVPVLCKHN